VSRPLVGFNMHPYWAMGDALAGFLAPLRAAGLRALEFGLDTNEGGWPSTVPLIENCQRLGFALSFHAPYLPPYTIAGFAGHERAKIEADYAPMLDIAARFGPATVVVHGAQSETRSQDEVYADTLAFFQWALERYPSLTFALENLNAVPGRARIGPDRAELLRLVQEIGDPQLGLCWDMGHDAQSGVRDTPQDAWLRHVCHVHVHDINGQGLDHFPLLYGRVPYQTWLPVLAAAGFGGIATLEIKGRQLSEMRIDWIIKVLVASIGEIQQLLSPTELTGRQA